ncbi:MAG: GlsB/YeaQ/YmgE family stress response membrane protein [Acidobacteria bacterium]|nr:GlsB/YeaQ/YmgE family stress response membrane protein [Acidobacteriota bacterium]
MAISPLLEVMLFLAWTIVGMISGAIWSLLNKDRRNESFGPTILLAICGAVLGGLLFTLFGTTSWTVINIYNLLVPMAGAIIFLAAYNSIKQAY